MIGFYYGEQVPSNSANEGIYFIDNDNKYSIYRKIDNVSSPIKYGEVNEVASADLDNLWSNIGTNFVAKTFTVAGLDMQDNISIADMRNALELQALAYKNEATGTITDYVTEVEGVNYTPTGNVEVILGYNKTALVSTGTYTPVGDITGKTTAKGSIALENNNNGFQISGSVSTPEINVVPNIETIKQITSVGTLPTYTPASYTAPSLSSDTGTFATAGMVASMNNEVLTITAAPVASAISQINFNEGSYTEAIFNQGTLPLAEDVSVATGITSATATQPVFIGNKIGASFIGEESNIDATFTGTEDTITVSGEYDKAIVQSTEFTGDAETIKPNLITEDKAITVN